MNMPLDNPGKPVEGAYYPTSVTPEEAFVAIGRLRKAARAEIERLIDWLDSTDNHMEREPDEDELDASFPESGSRLCTAGEDDEQDDPDEDDATEEYSLGFLERHPSVYGYDGYNPSGSQADNLICAGLRSDLEDEHDGGEPEDEGGEAVKEDDEPSLGWTVDGCIGNTPIGRDECELQDYAPYRPQERTDGPGCGATIKMRIPRQSG